MHIYGIKVPISTDSWFDSKAEEQVGTGFVYLVCSLSAESDNIYFQVVPDKVDYWDAVSTVEFLLDDFLSAVRDWLSEIPVPGITYSSKLQGPADTDLVNFKTIEFWTQVRAFVKKALESVKEED
jgi:hypothetical protein